MGDYKKNLFFPKLGLVGLTLLLLNTTSCRKDPPPPEAINYYYSYYPLMQGHYRIYEADSFIYRGINLPGTTETLPDTVHYQLKEVVTEPFTDNAGNQAYMIEKYFRNNENQPWAKIALHSALRSEREAQRFEENTRYVKLVFPVAEGKQWDANKYNVEDSAQFIASAYREVHKPWEEFDSTALVELENYEDFVNRYYNIERYAAGVGLVYLQDDSLNIQTKGNNKFINGYSVKMRLTESGK